MYESHFGFTSRPFTATPNADLFFPTPGTRQAFQAIASCVERASGAALIVGASGIGKSVFLQALGRHFKQDFSVAILESASVTSRKELLQNILFELGLPFHGMEEGELRLTLMDYLKPSDRCPNGLLLCVDEAHLMDVGLLEELRMITNLVREGQPRARLVMAGSYSIEERLADPKLESLNQRISTRAYLENMNASECRQYIEDHLQAVGKSANEIFDEEALDAVHVATHGIPRLVNQVCDHALVLAIADGKQRIHAAIINEAWSDIQRLPVEWHVLGSQTDTTNEHVIEFGELDASDETENSELTAPVPESPETDAGNTPEILVETGTAEDVVEETKSEEKSQEFVFDGPANPFEEKFENEEIVVDKFSQIIGHSPQQPQNPFQATLDSLQPFETPLNAESSGKAESSSDIESSSNVEERQTEQTLEEAVPTHEVTEFDAPASESDQESTGSSATNMAHESETVPTDQDQIEPVLVNMDFAEEQVEANKVTREPTSPSSDASESTQVTDSSETIAETSSQTDGSSTSDEPSTLESYFAGNTDAITFGVGQGIYADSFTPINPVEKDNNSTPVASEMDGQNASSTVDESEPTRLAQQPLEQEISQTVEEIRKFVNEQNSENAPTESADDRDMIIVQEESVEDNVAGAASDTVPMQESSSVKSTNSEPEPQVKREDYQQLFDRLRNG